MKTSVTHIKTSSARALPNTVSTYLVQIPYHRLRELQTVGSTKGVVMSISNMIVDGITAIVTVTDWSALVIQNKLVNEPTSLTRMLLTSIPVHVEELAAGEYHIPFLDEPSVSRLGETVLSAGKKLLGDRLSLTIFASMLVHACQGLAVGRMDFAGGSYNQPEGQALYDAIDAEIEAATDIFNNLNMKGAVLAHIVAPDEHEDGGTGWRNGHLHGQTEGWINLRRVVTLEQVEERYKEENKDDGTDSNAA